MKSLEKFADYGLTGTFFLVTQALFALFQYPGGVAGGAGPVAWLPWLHHALADLANLSGTPLSQLSLVLGFAAVFFCGLLLDLLGHWLVVFELRVFRSHLRHERHWVRSVVRLSRGRAGEDVESFLSAPCGSVFGGWRHYSSLFRDSLPPFRRLWSLLIAYVTTFCPVSEPEALADTLRLWRVTRAVSTTLVVVAFELWISCFPVTIDGLWRFGLAVVTFALAVGLDCAAYNRLCASLFSFGLTTFESRRPPPETTPRPRP